MELQLSYKGMFVFLRLKLFLSSLVFQIGLAECTETYDLVVYACDNIYRGSTIANH